MPLMVRRRDGQAETDDEAMHERIFNGISAKEKLLNLLTMPSAQKRLNLLTISSDHKAHTRFQSCQLLTKT